MEPNGESARLQLHVEMDNLEAFFEKMDFRYNGSSCHRAPFQDGTVMRARRRRSPFGRKLLKSCGISEGGKDFGKKTHRLPTQHCTGCSGSIPVTGEIGHLLQLVRGQLQQLDYFRAQFLHLIVV